MGKHTCQVLETGIEPVTTCASNMHSTDELLERCGDREARTPNRGGRSSVFYPVELCPLMSPM